MNSSAYSSNCLSPWASNPWAIIVSICFQKSLLVINVFATFGCKVTDFLWYMQIYLQNSYEKVVFAEERQKTRSWRLRVGEFNVAERGTISLYSCKNCNYTISHGSILLPAIHPWAWLPKVSCLNLWPNDHNGTSGHPQSAIGRARPLTIYAC